METNLKCSRVIRYFFSNSFHFLFGGVFLHFFSVRNNLLWRSMRIKRKTVMTKRQVFYSFDYKPDSWRVAQVRNIGVIEGNEPTSDNGWEQVKRGGENAIKRWIDEQMQYRSCTVVLVGTNTAGRKWINYEIIESWKQGMGIVGIHIHGLKDSQGYSSGKGQNPFDFLYLSHLVKCYEPAGRNSHEVYAWISTHLSNVVEEAIKIRKTN